MEKEYSKTSANDNENIKDDYRDLVMNESLIYGITPGDTDPKTDPPKNDPPDYSAKLNNLQLYEFTDHFRAEKNLEQNKLNSKLAEKEKQMSHKDIKVLEQTIKDRNNIEKEIASKEKQIERTKKKYVSRKKNADKKHTKANKRFDAAIAATEAEMLEPEIDPNLNKKTTPGLVTYTKEEELADIKQTKQKKNSKWDSKEADLDQEFEKEMNLLVTDLEVLEDRYNEKNSKIKEIRLGLVKEDQANIEMLQLQIRDVKAEKDESEIVKETRRKKLVEGTKMEASGANDSERKKYNEELDKPLKKHNEEKKETRQKERMRLYAQEKKLDIITPQGAVMLELFKLYESASEINAPGTAMELVMAYTTPGTLLPPLSIDQKRQIITYAVQGEVKGAKKMHLAQFITQQAGDKITMNAIFGDQPGQTPVSKLKSVFAEGTVKIDTVPKKDPQRQEFATQYKENRRRNWRAANLQEKKEEKEEYDRTPKDPNAKTQDKAPKGLSKRQEKKLTRLEKKGYTGGYSGAGFADYNETYRDLSAYISKVELQEEEKKAEQNKVYTSSYRIPDPNSINVTRSMLDAKNTYQSATTSPNYITALENIGKIPAGANTNESKLLYFNTYLSNDDHFKNSLPDGTLKAKLTQGLPLIAEDFNGIDLFPQLPPEFKSNGWPIPAEKLQEKTLNDGIVKPYKPVYENWAKLKIPELLGFYRYASYKYHAFGTPFYEANKTPLTIMGVGLGAGVVIPLGIFEWQTVADGNLTDIAALSKHVPDQSKTFKFGQSYSLGANTYSGSSLKLGAELDKKDPLLSADTFTSIGQASMYKDRQGYMSNFAPDLKLDWERSVQNMDHGPIKHSLSGSMQNRIYVPNPANQYTAVQAVEHGSLKPDPNFVAKSNTIHDYSAGLKYDYTRGGNTLTTGATFTSLNNKQGEEQYKRLSMNAGYTHNTHAGNTGNLTFKPAVQVGMEDPGNDWMKQRTSVTGSMHTGYNWNNKGPHANSGSVSLTGTYNNTNAFDPGLGAMKNTQSFTLGTAASLKLDPGFLNNNVYQFEVAFSASTNFKGTNTGQVFLILRPRK